MSAAQTVAAPANPTAALVAKLVEVAAEIPFVEKRGRNTSQSYNFAQATDVLRDVRAQLFARKVLVVPGVVPGSIRHFTETGGRSFVTTVDLFYRFFDADTGAMIEVPWVGAGADLGGEKGLYKAMTGGLKYVLLQTFLLPTSDDPENDALTGAPAPAEAAPAPAAHDSVAADAERPAAPRIPTDRAKAILDLAGQAGLVTMEDGVPSFSPVLKAKLATLGVEKIGLLNVDQAEDVEVFLSAELEG